MRKVEGVTGPQVPKEFRKDVKGKPSKDTEFFSILDKEIRKRGGWKITEEFRKQQEENPIPKDIWEGL